MEQQISFWALILGSLSIILGAFGAHALKEILTESQLTSFETGVRYQMYHAFFLLFIAKTDLIDAASKPMIFWLTLVGVILFSVSIYLLSAGPHFGINIKKFGFITPIGGLLMIAAWVIAAIKIIR